VIIDVSQFKRGKSPFVEDKRDLMLANYIGDAGQIMDSAAIPAAFDCYQWTRIADGAPLAYDTDVLYNNKAGCCVLSGIAHQARFVGALVGDQTLLSISADDVEKQYTALTGYDPTTGANDTGLVVRDTLNLCKNGGLFGGKLKSLAFAFVDWSDPVQLTLGIWLGGGLIMGNALPKYGLNVQDEHDRLVWTKPKSGWPDGQGPGTDGGHCTFKHAHGGDLDQDNTWGIPVITDTGWRLDCVDEAWINLLPQWGTVSGRAPNGFALQDLLSDARARGMA